MTLSAGIRPRAAGAQAVTLASRLRPRFKATWQNLARDRGCDAAIAARLAFEPGERMLAADRDHGGECAVIATDRALYHRFGPGEARAGGWTRLGWEQVARVGWDAGAGRLVVTCAALAGAAPARVALPLRQRGAIPELALERVAHTRLGRWRLAGGTCRAVIEARRRPVTGELLWSVTCGSDGHGADCPGLRARAERAITRLGAEFGAPPRRGAGLPPLRDATWRPRSGGTAAAAG